MSINILIQFFFFQIVIVITAISSASGSLHMGYGQLLQQHVANGIVDYQGFKKDESKLDAYLSVLDQTDPEKLTDKEKLAFYINAYNAYTIKLILQNFKNGSPVQSIKDIGGFFAKPWSLRFVKIGRRVYTLDNIEHDIIRPVFQDSRVHFAINCAAKSCPPLISEPYEAATIEKQLDENTTAFINDNNFTNLNGNILYVSKIFTWFSEDFLDGDILSFVTQYAKGSLKEKLVILERKVVIKYHDYDWSLNDR